jgi:hypothetical protein
MTASVRNAGCGTFIDEAITAEAIQAKLFGERMRLASC